MLQSRCCVRPLGATYCPVVSPSVTLTAISDHHLDPLIYYQRDANTQLGLQSLVFTVPKRGPRPSSPLSLHSPWKEAGESDDSGPWFQVQVAYESLFFFPLRSGYSCPFCLSHLVSYIQLFRQKHMVLLVWSLVILTSLAVGMNLKSIVVVLFLECVMRLGKVGQSALTYLCSWQFQNYVYVLLANCFCELWVSMVALDLRSAILFGYFVCQGLWIIFQS